MKIWQSIVLLVSLCASTDSQRSSYATEPDIPTHSGAAACRKPYVAKVGWRRGLVEFTLGRGESLRTWRTFSDAMRSSYQYAHGLSMDAAKTDAHASGSDLNASNLNAKMEVAVAMSVLANEFDFNVESSSLKTHLDAFYKDSLNAHIPVEFGLRYIRDELKGKMTAGQSLDELNEWRKTSTDE